jgi:hypothetical protein
MKGQGINKILSVATAALALLSINACGTTISHTHQRSAFQTDCSGSACFEHDSEADVALLSPNTSSIRSENDYLAQCGEQARMVHHEIQNCRAITVLTVPLDDAETATVPHTPSRGLFDSEK